MTLPEIKTLTEDFAGQHRALTAKVRAVETELANVRRKHLLQIMALVTNAATSKAILLGALQESPELFKSPRTRVFDGVKVGYQKKKGTTVIEDEDATIAKLQKLLGDDEAAKFCTVKVTVDKNAVNSMPAELMKKVDIQITADTDGIVVKTLDSEIEKLVAALLANGDEAATSIQEAA